MNKDFIQVSRLQGCGILAERGIVGKLWENLRESRWENGGEGFHSGVDFGKMSVEMWESGGFARRFAGDLHDDLHMEEGGVSLLKRGVLHGFHITYYYNY